MESFLRPSVTTAVSAQGAADAATAAAEGRVSRLHARDRDRQQSSGHDDLRASRPTRSVPTARSCCSSAAPSSSAKRAARCAQGAARVFVLWTEARTPTRRRRSARVAGHRRARPLGTSGQGRTGISSSASAPRSSISVIDGAVQAAAQSQGEGDDTVVVNPTTSQDVMTEVLKSTINIPPTVVKPQGDRIQVLVARDLDFRSRV